MPKIAWAKKLYNAYNSIKKDEEVYSTKGIYLGKSNGIASRCTATTPGSIQLDSGKWISGDVEKKDGHWILGEKVTICSRK